MLIHKPKLTSEGEPKGMKSAGWEPSHMAIIKNGICITIPKSRSQWKIACILQKAIEIIEKELEK